MNKIYPIFKLKNFVLLININDIPFIGTKRSMDVMCIQVDIKNRIIDTPWELDIHLKFNPWIETNEKERIKIINILKNKFTNKEILEKIKEPLQLCLIKNKD